MSKPSNPVSADETAPADVRDRILAAAGELLESGGRDALTTRSVALKAGVQPPTLYRLFCDKRGLLDAVAEEALAAYVATKATVMPDADPLTAFRRGWDQHVAFGLAHPALFAIMSGDGQPGKLSPAAAAGQLALRRKVHNLAAAGVLRVNEDRAVGLTHSACTGVILSLLSTAKSARDLGLADASREAVIEAITSVVPASSQPGPTGAAITLRASLDQAGVLTAGERHLMSELLDRIARG